VFFQAKNAPKHVSGWGSTPDPAAGAYDAPPDLLISRIVGPLPISLFFFDTFGVSGGIPISTMGLKGY